MRTDSFILDSIGFFYAWCELQEIQLISKKYMKERYKKIHNIKYDTGQHIKLPYIRAYRNGE